MFLLVPATIAGVPQDRLCPLEEPNEAMGH